MAKQYSLEAFENFPTVKVRGREFEIMNTVENQEKITEIMRGEDKNGVDEAVVRTALGDEAADYIYGCNLPYPALLQLFKVIIAAFNGTSVEELDKAINERSANGGKQFRKHKR